MKSKLWIATSGIPLNKDLRYDAADMEGLFLEAMDRTSIRRNYDQSEEAFSCLLGNLSNAEVLNRAVIYSRDVSGFTRRLPPTSDGRGIPEGHGLRAGDRLTWGGIALAGFGPKPPTRKR